MQAKTNKISNIFNLMWSEEAVKNIMRQNWRSLISKKNACAGQINKSLEALFDLDGEKEIRKYIDGLENEYKEMLLIELANLMRMDKCQELN